MIAIPETNRAYNAASIDTYQAAGLTEWEWVAYDEACDECSSQEGNHSIGDPYPPEHPNCRCGVSPVVDSLTDATSSQIDPEADAPFATDETDAQPADPLYSPILDKFPKVQPMSIEDAARGANPNYGVKPGYKTNCARVVQNYELRRRGYDVTANAFSNSDQNSFAYMNEVWENPLSPGKLTQADWRLKLTYDQNVGSDSNIVFPDLVVKKSVKAYDRVSSFILGNHPEGSRGFLQMNWGSRSGHVINWEVQNGKVVFVDAQSNEIWAPTDSYWKSGSNWRVLRVDNLRPTDNIANYVEGK
jgi:Papain fold toxin 1, glutamine deamidase